MTSKSHLTVEKIGFTILIASITLYALTITKELAIPLVLALIFFFIFSNISSWVKGVITKRFHKLQKLATIIANVSTTIILLLALFILYSIINRNISDLMQQGPKYEARLREKIRAIAPSSHIGESGDTLFKDDTPHISSAEIFDIRRHNYSIPEIRRASELLENSSNRSFDQRSGVLGGLKKHLPENLHSYIPEIELPDLSKHLMNLLDVGLIRSLGGVVTGMATNTSLITLYLIFLFLERKSFKDKAARLSEENRKYRKLFDLANKINHDILQYLKIKSVASLITGVISFTILQIAGIDFASFWAILIFILNFIPTIGSFIAVLFPVALSVVQYDSITSVFVLLLALTGVQVTIGNIVEPRFLGKTLNLSPLAIFIALIVWSRIWGILGMFLAVPIMVVTNIVLAQFEQTRTIAIILSGNGIITMPSADKEDEANE